MSSPIVELKIVVPRKIYERLEEIERKAGVKKEDIVVRAIVKVLEEFEE